MMKYKFRYNIYSVTDDGIRANYVSMVYTSAKRAYNGLKNYLEKNWNYMMAIMKYEPRFNICELAEDYSEKVIDDGFCKIFHK